MRPRLRVALAIAFVALLFALPAAGRPGGGSSFSGSRSGSSSSGSRSGSSSSGSSYRSSSSSSSSSGSSYRSSSSSSSSSGSSGIYSTSSGGSSNGSSGSSSGSSGGSAVVGFIVLLVIFLAIVLVFVAAHYMFRSTPKAWDAGYDAQPQQVAVEVPARRMLERIRALDQGFSVVVFEDFIGALYTQSLLAAGAGTLDGFSAYLSPEAFAVLRQRQLQGISVALPGSIGIELVDGLDDSREQFISVVLRIEANLSRRDPNTGAEDALYTEEQWVLVRNRRAQSKKLESTRVFACPNCSAPLSAVVAGKCRACQRDVASGAFDWVVQLIEVNKSEARGPMLTGSTEEAGTNWDTIVDGAAQTRVGELSVRDPAFQWPGFQSRVNYIFQQFQAGWSNRDLAQMRPYFSDALFSTQTFWVSEYLRQKLRNVTEGAAISRIDLARVTSDAHFDAITVRIFASSLDYTLADATGQVVGGSRSERRAYSEYWTLIRSRGVQGLARAEPKCPRCSAPISVTVTGECKYCKAKVTSGEFDWVLSRIEQDEVYQA